MRPELFTEAAEIFLKVCDLKPAERTSALDTACSGNAPLREEVESLLAHDCGSEPAARKPLVIPDYELLRVIGRGGFGEVWLARNKLDRQHCAVKLFRTAAPIEVDGLCQYKRRVAEHPHLVPILHAGEAEGTCYCVMPLADDACASSPLVDPEQYEPMTLAGSLQRQGRLPVEEVVAIGKQMLSALGHLHSKGAHHGDVKPANIMKVRGRWQLGDQGLVGALEADRPRGFSPHYCPPEGPGGAGGDLYALGVTLLQLATGEPPDRLDEVLAGRLKIPGNEAWAAQLTSIIRRALAKEPAQRFRSARDMLDALEAIKPGGRSRIRLAVAATLLVVVGASVIVATSRPWVDSKATASPDGNAGPPVSSLPVPIEIGLRVVLFRGESFDLVGEIGLPLVEARYDDSAEVLVEFSEPAYCYVLALNPDGLVQRCYPPDDQTPPQLQRTLTAPVLEDGTPAYLGLNDAAGAQAFVVAASRDPLPPYAEWIGGFGELPWRRFQTDGVWQFDGERLEPLSALRGELRRRRQVPEAFRASVATLKRSPGIHSVKAILFPVQPLEAAPPPPDVGQ